MSRLLDYATALENIAPEWSAESKKALAEIERLERELAEAQRSRSAFQQLLIESEAQAAAMREALRYYGEEENWSTYDSKQAYLRDGRAWETAQAALSPTAGANVLKVVERMRQLINVIDSGNLEMNSPEIGGEDDVPFHRWHEEWLHYARQALAALDGGKP